jgi:hypothetical protein
MKLFFPLIILIWLLLFSLTKSSSTDKTEKLNIVNSKLRGSIFSKLNIEELTGNIHVVQPNHAVIVAGHSVMRLNKLSIADKDDSSWYLLGYQINQGFSGIISSHIQRGIKIANDDVKSLLLFSGGQTRRDVGPTSEAASYYYLAIEKKWIKNSMIPRVYLEEYARDSFENLLFSICRFREITGKYPKKITVVGFDFKEDRYTELHRHALGFPLTNFTYSSVVTSDSKFNHGRALEGEKIAVNSFKNDLYGCENQALNSKRDIRNPFQRTIPYELACPEIKELLLWCGPELFTFIDKLPWNIK